MIDIITDSCSDLSPELIKDYNIQVVPLHIYLDGRNILDGELPLSEFFSLAEKAPELPKTSAPTQKEFLDRFSSSNNPKIFIGISSRLSATIANATVAAANLPGQSIHIIDSLSLSTGIGLLALKAAELRDAGFKADEIVAEVNRLVSHVHTTFIIDTLDYLYKGGRCSATEHLVGSLLKIRPVIQVLPDGSLGVKEKLGGARKKALTSMLKDFEMHLSQIDLHRVFITHTGCDADAEYLAAELRKMAAIENLHFTCAGGTVASHCGPNTIGILYFQNPG